MKKVFPFHFTHLFLLLFPPLTILSSSFSLSFLLNRKAEEPSMVLTQLIWLHSCQNLEEEVTKDNRVNCHMYHTITVVIQLCSQPHFTRLVSLFFFLSISKTVYTSHYFFS